MGYEIHQRVLGQRIHQIGKLKIIEIKQERMKEFFKISKFGQGKIDNNLEGKERHLPSVVNEAIQAI